MAKPSVSKKISCCFNDAFVYISGASLGFLLVWSLWSYYPTPNLTQNFNLKLTKSASNSTQQCMHEDHPATLNLHHDPPHQTFYDEPDLSYSIEKTMKNWDDKRKEWLKHHPSFAAAPDHHQRVVLVTGSQPKPCKNPVGDHLLLRFFKNKVDYCRIHGYDIFYNNALLHPKMYSYWAKLPVVKAAMLAHPEAEWIWWVDSDALFTDMEFRLPLHRYRDFNLVVHGWENLIYEKKMSTALNAGVFLIRNCQWSMDFMAKWAGMGPISSDYQRWGEIQRSMFKDKLFPEADDQSGLIYLLYQDKSLLKKIYLESEYYFDGYWLERVPTYDNITEKYMELERKDGKLRRRHAEKVSEQYAVFREPHLNGERSMRRPFITHFTGCEPCSGDHNQMYEEQSCWNGMIKAFNFADNQVLRNYGFVHPDLLDSETLTDTPSNHLSK